MGFLELARQYEREFMEDMAALGVRPPTALTRVSEFIPQVIENVGGILHNRFAYESNGSVYFDVPAYMASSHSYGKLVPENVGNVKELEEGEGERARLAGGGGRVPPPPARPPPHPHPQAPCRRARRTSVTRPTLRCGRHPRRASRGGRVRGDRGVPGGILSARP